MAEVTGSSSSERCDSCEFDYFLFIKEFHGENEKSVAFLRKHGVLPDSVKCPLCDSQCHFRVDQRMWCCGHTYKLRKSKKRRKCSFSVSDNNLALHIHKVSQVNVNKISL